MAVMIDLPLETEAKLREEAQRRGTSLEEHLRGLAQGWANAKGADAKGLSEVLSQDEWIKEFRAWTASHKPLPIIADDSRESIYAGRGE